MPECDIAAYAGRMREAREKLGVCMDAAAQMIGVCRSVVRYWENGQRVPTAWSLYQICQAYGVSADWLLGLEEGKQ